MRFNDIGTQQDLLSLRSQLQELAAEQNAVCIRSTEERNQDVIHSRAHEKHVLAAIQDLHDLVAQHGSESTHHQNALSGEVARSFSEIKTQLTEISTRQDGILSLQKVQVATAQIEATDDGSRLAQVIRHELQQQLAPLVAHIGKEHVDRVANAFSSQVVENNVVEDDPISTAKSSKDSRVSNMPNLDHLPGEAVIEGIRSKSTSSNHTSIRPRRILFFSISHCIYTRFGVLIFRIKKYPQCMSATPSNHVYFTLAVEILPWPRISSRGFSAIYSSGPDLDGYRSIFPSISMINIIPLESEAHRLIVRDDLRGLRLLLERGVVGIWDRGEDGWNLLEVCMFSFIVFRFS